MIGLASASLELNIDNTDWSFVCGDRISHNIEVCNYLEDSEVFLSYDIIGNSYDMNGINFSFSENPVTFNGCKDINLTIDSQLNYKPDNFSISITAMTSVSETLSYTTENNSIVYEDLGIELIIESTTSGTIEVIKTTTNPKKNFAVPELGIFLDIKSNDKQDSTVIKVRYTDEELRDSNIEESTLRLYYFNETSQLWEKYDGIDGGVNTDDNYVWARTTHFSVWGAFGSSIIIPAPAPSPSSGGTKTIYKNITQNQTAYVKEYINVSEPCDDVEDEIQYIEVVDDFKIYKNILSIMIWIPIIIILLFLSAIVFIRVNKKKLKEDDKDGTKQ